MDPNHRTLPPRRDSGYPRSPGVVLDLAKGTDEIREANELHRLRQENEELRKRLDAEAWGQSKYGG